MSWGPIRPVEFDFNARPDVSQVFEHLALPLPGSKDMLAGSEGHLCFLNDYALVLRIEFTRHATKGQRLVHPLILQPLLSIPCDDLTLEICPALPVPQDDYDVGADLLRQTLHKDGIDFWDDCFENTGLLNTENNHSHTVVIDRLGVTRMTERLLPVKEALARHGHPQKVFLPLRRQLKRAWNDPREFAQFYELCRSFKKAGIITNGWSAHADAPNKCGQAHRFARHYAPAVQKYHQKNLGLLF